MPTSTRTYQLKAFGLPVIHDLIQFSEHTRISKSTLQRLIGYSDHYYKTYSLLKKSGGRRLIAQPNRELKSIQSWILRNILDKLSSSDSSTGFEKGSSIADNAFPHIGANVILALDIDNFFPSIPANKVYTVFSTLGYSKPIAASLTNICTFRGGLPQGSPTSPKLANLICSHLDARIQGYAGKNGMIFTRYADDITLSCQSVKKITKAAIFLKTIITDEGFKVNDKKTRLMGLRKRKSVTGLVINPTKAGIGRKVYRDIRVKIHNLFIGETTDFAHVNGWLAFTYGIDKGMYNKLITYVKKLGKRYPTSIANSHIWQKRTGPPK